MESHVSEESHQKYSITSMSNYNINSNKILTGGKLSFDLVNIIEQQIQNDQFQVNQTKKQFKLKNKNNNDEFNKQMSELLKQKHQLQNQFNHIEREQMHRRQSSIVSMHSQKKYFKSEITQEEVDKIKKIKFMQKKYQMDLQNKTKAYQQNLKRFEEEEKELLQKQKKQKNEQRLKEVAKKIEQIRKRQEERGAKLQEQKKKLIEIKAEKKLYQRLDERYKQVQMIQQKKKAQIKQALKEQKVLKFDDIKQHQKKYDNIMRVQRQERERKLGELSKSTNKKYYHNKIFNQILEKEQKVKVQHIEKKNEIKQKFIKKEEYAEHVRANYKPAIRQDIEQKQTKNQPRSISVAELNKLGNDYMKQANQNLANSKVNMISKVQQKKEAFKYKDYLKEIQVGRKISSQHDSRYLQQIDNLMKKQNMTQQQKFIKAKQIALKLQDNKGSKGKNSQRFIDSINAKIYLLKQIQSNQ